MKRSLIGLSAFLVSVLWLSQVWAHYLWVTIDGNAGDHGTTNVYFEGGPGPGNGQYLGPFIERGVTWIRTPDKPKAAPLKMNVVKQPGKRWLSAVLPAAGPRSVDSYCEYGVSRVGGRMLSYYARNLEVASRGDLQKLARAETLKPDLVPRFDGDSLELTLLWQGKPAPGRSVSVRGAKDFRANLTTDESGKIRLTPKAGGQYRFHGIIKNAKSGTYKGREFQVIEHHVTLLMKLPLAE